MRLHFRPLQRDLIDWSPHSSADLSHTLSFIIDPVYHLSELLGIMLPAWQSPAPTDRNVLTWLQCTGWVHVLEPC